MPSTFENENLSFPTWGEMSFVFFFFFFFFSLGEGGFLAQNSNTAFGKGF